MPPTPAPHPPVAARRRPLWLTSLVAAVVAGVLTLTGLQLIGSAQAAGATLHSLAQAKGKYFGAEVNEGHFSETAYSNLAGSEFGQVTPENSMKWDTIEPSRGSFNYTKGDQVVSFAQSHNQLVRGHNLVWHSQLPGWVSSLPLNQVQAAMENHITEEVTHYKGKIYAWDVVNEPFNDDGTFRTDVFHQAMGVDYIADALRTARAADPAAKLYLNDYNIEGTGAKADAMFNLVKSLKAAGAPIDGVGFETHLAIQFGFPTSMQQNLQRFADLGVDVAITELDIRMQTPRDANKDNTQATFYSNVVKACLAVTRCVGLTTWGFTDKYSWVPDTFGGEGAALQYDENYQPKPAYNAMVTALGGSGGTTGGTTTNGGTTNGGTTTGGTTTGGTTTGGTTNGGTTGGTGSGCTATYHTDNDWGSGFTATVTVTNNGGSATKSWQVTWSWSGNQQISNSWNTTLTQSGKSVTAKNAPHNAVISAGGNTTFGFQAGYSGSNSAPTLTCSAT